MWEELREIENERKEEMEGEKKVNVFESREDEKIGWIKEKDDDLYGKGYGKELEKIKDIVRKKKVFENDIDDVKEKVD